MTENPPLRLFDREMSRAELRALKAAGVKVIGTDSWGAESYYLIEHVNGRREYVIVREPAQ